MKFIKKYHWVACFLLSVVVLKAQAQERIKIDGVAAVVGDKIILDSDIVKYKQEIESRAKGKQSFNDCDIMEDIMTQKLLGHHAVIDSIEVSDAEVDSGVQRTLTHFKTQMGNMDKVVALYGFDDVDDLTNELKRIEKENLLIQRERQSIVKDVVVTPEEVRFFYSDLKKKGDLPSFGVEVELSQISVKAKPTKEAVKKVIDKLKEIKKDIDNGYSMRLKAILYSEDPGVAQNGGKYTITRQSQFVKEFKEAAFSMAEGEVSDPFKSQFGYHILQVEKIKGLQRDVRHLLIQPKIEENKLTKAKEKLDSIKIKIQAGELTFKEAVLRYSEDKATNLNQGRLVNPYTNDAKFDLNKMDPKLFAQIDNVKESEITDVFYEENREGEKIYKIVKVTKRTDAHEADLVKDYVKIQQLASQKKEEETLEKWYNAHIKDTYLKLGNAHKKCDFKYKWIH